MRPYEVMVILDAGLEEEVIRATIDRATNRSTSGRASSVMEPLKYSPVPTNVRNAILEEVG